MSGVYSRDVPDRRVATDAFLRGVSEDEDEDDEEEQEEDDDEEEGEGDDEARRRLFGMKPPHLAAFFWNQIRNLNRTLRSIGRVFPQWPIGAIPVPRSSN
jgi:hypothetical protein